MIQRYFGIMTRTSKYSLSKHFGKDPTTSASPPVLIKGTASEATNNIFFHDNPSFHFSCVTVHRFGPGNVIPSVFPSPVGRIRSQNCIIRDLPFKRSLPVNSALCPAIRFSITHPCKIRKWVFFVFSDFSDSFIIQSDFVCNQCNKF